ncbi:NAD(P)/FAD-dependent oxidoreductase [Maribacter dokdonensis]|uniref:NAD(P)/FAD-dependent oxidoreductase n=1 Tax=Maribacter dokdonensis TaxID=320912 RepID=UPI001C0855A2|nr:NAD(P)/FAD-dependent oxidoreductase [Maribacter dokdonensis]MBU2900242.1 NAD(P)/FAD-dependent oxidoreductase [Maribacter dokdonensis]
MVDSKIFDVIIIGGSYAGLSAAMSLGRSLRNVLIIDGGKPCNRQTPHSHNFITQDGVEPSRINELAKDQVLNYDTVEFIEDFALRAKKTESGFNITTLSGKVFNAHKLIFSSGIKDIMPDIPGFSDCWGISIIHCPYCHGFENKGKKTGIYASIPRALHLAPLIKNLTGNLTLIIKNMTDLKEDEIQILKNNQVKFIVADITSIEHDLGNLTSIGFSNGEKHSFEALYASLPFEQHSQIPQELGCTFTDDGYIDVTPFQETSIKGVYACGDNSNMFRSVANAVNTGNFTGAKVNADLANGQFK